MIDGHVSICEAHFLFAVFVHVLTPACFELKDIIATCFHTSTFARIVDIEYFADFSKLTLLIRIYAVNSKNIVSAAQKYHSTMPLATAALGRLLTGAVIMGSMMKEEDSSLTLQLNGDGPLGRLLAVANSKGEVKIGRAHV